MEGAFPAGPRWARGLGWSILVASALVAAGCSNYVGTTAASFLRRIKTDPDPNLRYVAYAKLAQPGCYDSAEQKAEAVKVLLAKLEQGKEPVATRAVIINTLGALRDPAARDAVVKLASDPEPVLRVQACRALGKVGKPEDATILTRVMSIDTLEDCRIAAIDSLGDLKATDPRILRMLVTGMRNEDPATRLASLKALRKITGKDLGIDAVAWSKIIPQDGDAQVATAATTPAGLEPVSTKAPYPPSPAAVESIVDSKKELAGKATRARSMDDPREQAAPRPEEGASPPPGAGVGSYPTTNPNFAPQSR